MIIYFTDRHLNILGQASTHLPEGVRVIDDLKTEDIDTGVSIFECKIPFDRKTRAKVEDWAEVGNFILRSSDDANEFYNIIDVEIDTKKQEVYIYAEDDGLDLINDVAEAYEASEPHPIDFYVELFAGGAGWEVGINEVEGLVRQLSWESEQTACARLLNIAEAFNNCEISFSFEINGLKISKKYINIYEERGKRTGVQLRLNKEIDRIITTKSVANLATALKVTGGTPDDSEDPITLLGYEYDDDDFYVDGAVLKSRKALEKWSRYLWKDDDSQQLGGHIVKSYSYDTTSQAVLCEKAIAELKTICDMEVNYDIDITKLPENVRVGDRVNIVDDAGGLYLSSRVLILETSAFNNERRAVLGEHLIRKDGISSKVEKLAAKFAKNALSAARAKAIATNAKKEAQQAQTQANNALKAAENVETAANNATSAANTAAQVANTAAAQAQAANAAVTKVEQSVSSIEETVSKAQAAAENAQQAAQTATGKAEESATAAKNAAEDAEAAEIAANNAQDSAENAVEKAETAKSAADEAKADAEEATVTAIAAKLDAEQAEKDVSALGDELETVSNTMKIGYARKTELTETTADLQTQISRNAAEIESSAYKQMVIDETTNNALSKLEAAQAAAALAQEEADSATAQAEAAQQAADEALVAANDAQAEADTAQAAYEEARRVADEAAATLLAAKKDLATVSARADATEEEIAAAQAALTAAETAANAAKGNADKAAQTATNALNAAIEAVATAEKAQAAANDAAYKAVLAQENAAEAQGNATAAQTIADEAAAIAATAQATADTARETANTAQETANAAYTTATEAQKTAEAAQKTLQQANVDLAAAESRLAEVMADVGATTADVEAAQAAVNTAQAAANAAKTNADAAQTTADNAKTNADTAQAAADEAKKNADEAQMAADEAQRAADEAQGYVYALAKRSIEVEAKIKQNADEIELKASKSEVAETLGGYSTKEEMEAAISVKAGEITSTVNKTVEDLQAADKSTADRVTASETTIKQLSDNISMLVKGENGESMMIYDETSATWSFSTAKIQEQVNSASASLSELVEKYGSVEAAVEAIRQGLTDITDKTDFISVGTYTYTEDGVEKEEPCIDLFEIETGFTVKITNTKILFSDGANTPTRIETDGLTTENITIENELRQTNDNVSGFFVWEVRSNGNYGLSWKESDS